MVVDSSSDGYFKTRPGGIVLYALNYDLEEVDMFTEIEYIDGTDFTLNG